MRVLLILALAAALAAGCGPTGPAEEGGEAVDPVALLGVLPSPGELRGGPPEALGAAGLPEVLTGSRDPGLTERIEGLGLRGAAVRRWEAPGGGALVAAVSVWPSRLVARGVASDSAGALLERPGARAWTPRSVRGSHGARREGPPREIVAARSDGPNAFYVRAAGPVPEDVVARQLRRLLQAAGGDGVPGGA